MFNKNALLLDLEDYMFTSKNINRYTKHMIQNVLEPKESTKNFTAFFFLFHYGLFHLAYLIELL